MDLFFGTTGPRDARVICIGEAWGAEEEKARSAFKGPAGYELNNMLFEAGLRRDEILCTNVVNARPNMANDFASGFTKPNSQKDTTGYILHNGIYIKEEYYAHVEKLRSLISTVKPDLIIGCGNWPLWALTERAAVGTVQGYKIPSGITKWRGSQLYISVGGRDYPYLPVIHPAAILRQWTMRATTVHDFRFRAGQFLTGELNWKSEPRAMFAEPNYHQVIHFIDKCEMHPDWIAVDVETYARSALACVGLAHADSAICIPFFYFDENGQMVDVFTAEEEYTICRRLKLLLESKDQKITNQNISYDAQWLWRMLGIRVRPVFDTMVAHHLLFPGTPKALHNLASLYCNHYVYWKDESEEWDVRQSHVAMWEYNCKDTLATLEITRVLHDAILRSGMKELLAERMDQWNLTFEMTRRGMRYDVSKRNEYIDSIYASGREISDWLLDAVPEDLRYSSGGKPWYNSPKMQAELFYHYLGLPVVRHKKTKRPTADGEALETLRKKAPWWEPLFKRLDLMRSINVFRSHFLDVQLNPQSRFSAEFKIAGTETFRWSSSSNAFGEGTNMQNIPKPSEE